MDQERTRLPVTERSVYSHDMHEYELVAKGVVTCYAFPVGKDCEASLPFEARVRLSDDDDVIESSIDDIVTAKGWCEYSHPGGMRYRPQWYCPRHVEAILEVPDDEKDEFARNLKYHLRPDPMQGTRWWDR